MNITIIGTGNMGRGIGHTLIRGGHHLTLIDQQPDAASALADELRAAGGAVQTAALGASIPDEVVVLAVWYPVTLDLARTLGSALAGKTVIDIANPLNATFDGLATPPGASAAEELQDALPGGTTVVKAFNTTFAGTLIAGSVADQTPDVFIASDSAAARAVVAGLVSDGGLVPHDVGGLERARQLEGLGFLGITMQEPLGLGFASGWRLVH